MHDHTTIPCPHPQLFTEDPFTDTEASMFNTCALSHGQRVQLQHGDQSVPS